MHSITLPLCKVLFADFSLLNGRCGVILFLLGTACLLPLPAPGPYLYEAAYEILILLYRLIVRLSVDYFKFLLSLFFAAA